jgi:hypothetical protein
MWIWIWGRGSHDLLGEEGTVVRQNVVEEEEEEEEESKGEGGRLRNE